MGGDHALEDIRGFGEMIKIDKNVPIPPRPHRNGGAGRRGIYPWFVMEVGDSFFTDRHTSDVSAAYPRKLIIEGWKFTLRTVDGGTRVWRVK